MYCVRRFDFKKLFELSFIIYINYCRCDDFEFWFEIRIENVYNFWNGDKYIFMILYYVFMGNSVFSIIIKLNYWIDLKNVDNGLCLLINYLVKS